MRVKVTVKPKPHPYPDVDRLINGFTRALTKRWKAAAPELMRLFAKGRKVEELRKAQGDDPSSLFRAPTPSEMNGLDFLLQELLGPEAGTPALFHEYVRPAFAFGVGLASNALNDDLTPLSQEEALGLAQTPRLLDGQAMAFVEGYAFSAITSKDASTFATLQTRLLETLERRQHPMEAARALAQDLDDDLAGWYRIARTETSRALAAGSMEEARRLGADHVYVPENGAACEDCQRLVVGRVFRRQDLEGKSNYRRKKASWIPAVPLHPNCTCHAIPASQWLVDQAMEATGGSPVPPDGVSVEWVSPAKR